MWTSPATWPSLLLLNRSNNVTSVEFIPYLIRAIILLIALEVAGGPEPCGREIERLFTHIQVFFAIVANRVIPKAV